MFIKYIRWINVEDVPVNVFTYLRLFVFTYVFTKKFTYLLFCRLNMIDMVFLSIDDVSPYRTQRNVHHEGEFNILQEILENKIATKEIRHIRDIGVSL